MHTVLRSADASRYAAAVRRITPNLRNKRDLLARRRWRSTVRSLARIGILLTGDICASLLSVAATVWLLPGSVANLVLETVPLVLLLLVLGQSSQGTYGFGDARRDYGRITKGVLLSIAGFYVVGRFYPSFAVHPGALASLTVCLAVTCSVWRRSFDLLVSAAHRRGIGVQRMLIVGTRHDVMQIKEHILQANDASVDVIGYVSPEGPQEIGSLGAIDHIDDAIERNDIHTVLVSANLPVEEFRYLIEVCFHHGTSVSVVPGTINELRCRALARNILGWPLLELDVPQFHVVQIILKRVLDIVGSLVGLILLSPVFALIAIAIKLDSPGPVIFRQMRPGLGGKRFGMLKFRTMRVDAEDVLRRDPVLYKRFLENGCKLPDGEDPRIFRVGRFLRKTSLDELPQLINVLRAEMSLVGPRPIVGPEIEHYGVNAAVFLAVKPGMTGYWQINGRSEVGYPERAEMDLYYINNWSLLLDLWILLVTVPRVVMRRGAH